MDHQSLIKSPIYCGSVRDIGKRPYRPGPLVESNVEIWDEIDAALSKGKVETAAAALRHHLEYVSRHLADELGARPRFRADGNYELGDLLTNVLGCMNKHYGKAAKAAQSWGK